MMERNLSGRKLPGIGLGCMGMSEFYGETDECESLLALEAALEKGYRHFDTADMYGMGRNESLIGDFISRHGTRRKEIFIATKGGIVRDTTAPAKLAVDSSPAYLRRACEASLKRLKVDVIDLYYLHRKSPAIPIHESVGALADLKWEGKIRSIGLSEISVETLEDAIKESRIDAVQAEYSLWTRGVEAELLPACEKHGIGFVAFSPLGRGFLAGELEWESVTGSRKDIRSLLPRFQKENFVENSRLLAETDTICKRLGCSKAELALRWVLSKGNFIHAIPGTKKIPHLTANFEKGQRPLDRNTLLELDRIFEPGRIRGERYPTEALKATKA